MGRTRADNIFELARDGSPEELAAHIAAGGNVTAAGNEGETPLHYAVKAGRVDLARVLLDQGAPLDAVTKYGGSPLFECAYQRELLEVAALLLERGADPNRSSAYDGAPLHAAASRDNVALIELLIAKGATIDGRDQRGSTPLHVAASQGHAGAVAALLRLGADPKLVTPNGKSPRALTSSAKVKALLPTSPAEEALERAVDEVFATFTALGWFKYVPVEKVDDVRARFRDAYFVQPTLIAPYEKRVFRGIDGRSCAADVEEVAEGSAHEVLLHLRDALKEEGVAFEEVETVDGVGGYDLVVDGERFEVSNGSMRDQSEALDRLVAVTNQLLSRAGSTERLYSVGMGNDAAVVLLSPALVAYAKTLPLSPPLNEPRT